MTTLTNSPKGKNETVSKQGFRPFQVNLLMFILLVLYNISSYFFPKLEHFLSYGVFVLASVFVSFLLLAYFEIYVLLPNLKQTEKKKVENLSQLKSGMLITVCALFLLFFFVIFTFDFPSLLKFVNIKVLSLVIFSVSVFWTFVAERIIKQEKLSISSENFRAEALKRRLFFSIIILFLAPICVFFTFFYPAFETKVDIKVLFLSIIVASLIGLRSVSKDITTLLTILAKAKLVATGQSTEKLVATSTPEIRDLAESFNIIISDLQKKMEELKNAKQRVEFLVTRIGKAVSATHKMDELLKLILEISTDAIRADRGYLYFIDPLKNAASWEIFPASVEENRDIEKLQDKMKLLMKSGDFIHEDNFLAFPLIRNEKVLGVLGTERKTGSPVFQKEDGELLHNIARQAALAIDVNQLEEGAEKVYFEIISTLALAIETKDPYTRGHSQRTQKIATAIAEKMNVPQEVIQKVKDGAFLHDIGKVGIPDGILNKQGPLTPAEYAVIKKHPYLGEYILKPIHSLKNLLPGIRSHHERCDGTGYPNGLKEFQIDLSARIICVADSVDAMFSERPYRHAYTLQQIKQQVREGSGTQFSKEPAEALLELLEEKGEDMLK